MKRRFYLLLVALFALAIVPFAYAQEDINLIWRGQYYDNAYLGGNPVLTRDDGQIAFNWGFGSPGLGIGPNNFSIRWTARVNLPAGTYRFYARADDNVSVVVDNETANPVIDTFQTARVGELVSGDVTLDAGIHDIQVNYREVTETAYVFVSVESLSDGADGPDFDEPEAAPVTGGTWLAAYYDNASLVGTPIATETVYTPGADWEAGSPLPAVPVDNWSARYTTTQTLGGGTYRLRVNADDGVRVYIDDTLYIDEWHEATRDDYVADVTLAEGAHDFVIEYYESRFRAYLGYSFNRISVDPAPDPALEEATITGDPLVLRDSPDAVTGGVLGIIYAGNEFFVTEQETAAGWLQVRYNGTYGWINSNEADIVESAPPQSEPITDASLVAPTYTVNIRQGPGTQFEDIGNLPPDRAVSVVGRNEDNTWFKINYNDIVGWVTTEYTRLQPGTPVSEIPIADA